MNYRQKWDRNDDFLTSLGCAFIIALFLFLVITLIGLII